MDTPDRSHCTPTSLSKIEDSPVFRYISSLSPIEPVKSVHTSHAFSSPTFASPSLFLSPQISSHRESRFSIRRHQFSEASNSDFLRSGNENNTKELASEDLKQSDPCNEQVGCLNNGHLQRKLSSDLLNEELNLAIELPKTLKYDSGSPDSNLVPGNEMQSEAGVNVARMEGSPVDYSKDELKEKQLSFENEIDLRKICRIKQNEAATGYDWVKMVSDAAEMLIPNPSPVYEDNEGQDQKTADPGTITFISTVLQLPQDKNGDLENAEAGGPSDFCRQSGMEEPMADQGPAILPSDTKDAKGESCSNASAERSIRRRCLMFEMPGAHKNKQVEDPISGSSTSLGSDSKVALTENHLVSTETGIKGSSSISPGIGLHLNSLLTNLKCELNTFDKTMTPLPLERNQVADENDVMCIENSPQRDKVFVDDEVSHNSPRKKRYKVENVEENLACKRCNCKRSKCLKLYCECFAAGLYCIEPCSCQDCFNKPVHESTVLETRRQIESRNPLAFAPKVIRSTDSLADIEGENNKTPASARHKRGCNCRKSSCLKKYCECFQGGVGCSPSCRCEGCKNTFGRKDGSTGSDGAEFEVNEIESCDTNASQVNSSNNETKKNEQEYSDLSMPSDMARPPIQQRFDYIGKPQGTLSSAVSSSQFTTQKMGASKFLSRHPKFKSNLQVIPEDNSEVLKSTCAPPPGCVKTTSPNSKRVSPILHKLGPSTTLRGSRKLILRSVPPFPSLSPPP